jgi:hypothetical protein
MYRDPEMGGGAGPTNVIVAGGGGPGPAARPHPGAVAANGASEAMYCGATLIQLLISIAIIVVIVIIIIAILAGLRRIS